ncbi:neprilysin-3-like [Ixodes scapularis]
MNWITMVIHYYLMWASSYRLQRMSVWSNSKCTEYLWAVAPFALQALYAQEHVSINQVEVAKHMFRQMSYAFRHKLKWMTNSSRKEALERFHSLVPIIGVPDDFYSPLRMDKHYSYLPKFKAPFVVSILLALEAKANFELFNFMVTRFGKWADASRWKSPFVLEAAETRGLYISANAFYLSYYMAIFIPSPIMAMPFMDEDMAVISYAGLGHSIAHEAMHAYDMGHIDERINGMKGAWGYQVNGGFSQRVDCITRLYDGLVVEARKNYTRSTLYENMADIAGMELTLAAMQNDSCYRPDVRPRLVGNTTQQQLFFIAYCHQYCSSDASLKAYKISGHPRNDHRCNIVVSVTPEFREAFRCPVPQTEQCHYLT